MKLYYFYDKKADVLYFSEGKPSANSISREADNDIVIRLDPKTKRIKGFTVLNAAKRLLKQQPIELPITVKLTPSQ